MNTLIIIVTFGPPLLILGACAFDCWKREIQLRAQGWESGKFNVEPPAQLGRGEL